MSRGKLRKYQIYGTLTINLPAYIKQDVRVKAEEAQEPISTYMKHCIIQFLKFMKAYEPYIVDGSQPAEMQVGSMSKIGKAEYDYLYTLIVKYKLFPSRSELVRFAVFITKMLEVMQYPPVNPNEEEEGMEAESEDFEYKVSLEELRELYPKLPDYKFINEE